MRCNAEEITQLTQNVAVQAELRSGLSDRFGRGVCSDHLRRRVSRIRRCKTLNLFVSATNVRTREYKDGPNFNQRHETVNCVLYAIRNGGFSSGPMPQNIITGPEAQEVAKYVAENSKPSPTGVTAVKVPDCPAG